MAKIIVKAPFYKPGHKTEKGQSRGGYAKYIGTREGVEILRSGMAGYTHVTSDMQKSASAVVGNMLKNIMIKD